MNTFFGNADRCAALKSMSYPESQLNDVQKKKKEKH